MSSLLSSEVKDSHIQDNELVQEYPKSGYIQFISIIVAYSQDPSLKVYNKEKRECEKAIISYE